MSATACATPLLPTPYDPFMAAHKADAMTGIYKLQQMLAELAWDEQDGEGVSSASDEGVPSASGEAEFAESNIGASTRTASDGESMGFAKDCRVIASDPVEYEENVDKFVPKDVRSDVRLLLAKAQRAEAALGRGATGPIDLGRWAEEVYHLMGNTVDSHFKLAYIDGRVLYYGDPTDPHDHAVSSVNDQIDAFLSWTRPGLFQLGTAAVQLDNTDGTNYHKEPDLSWSVTERGEVTTVFEAVWANERCGEFQTEMHRWSASGRNAFGVKFWWLGKTGKNALNLATADAEDACSILILVKDSEWQRWKVYRVGEKAERANLSIAREEMRGPVVPLPARWFTTDERAPTVVPLFVHRVQHRIKVAIDKLSGLPPATSEQATESELQLRLRDVDVLSGPVEDIPTVTRQRLLVGAQIRLAEYTNNDSPF